VGLRIGRSRLELKRHSARDRIRCIHRARRLEDLDLAPISPAIVRSIVDWAASSQEKIDKPRRLADLFLRANTAPHLLVFLLVSEAIGSENYFKFNRIRQ
jgi:hypothetical protein